MPEKDFKKPKIKVGKKLPKNLNVTKINMKIAEVKMGKNVFLDDSIRVVCMEKIIAKIDSKNSGLIKEALADLSTSLKSRPEIIQRFITEYPTKISEIMLCDDSLAIQKCLYLVKLILRGSFILEPVWIESIWFAMLSMFSHFDTTVRVIAINSFFQACVDFFKTAKAHDISHLIDKFIETIFSSGFIFQKDSSFDNFKQVFSVLASFYTKISEEKNQKENNAKTVTIKFIPSGLNLENLKQNVHKIYFTFSQLLSAMRKNSTESSLAGCYVALADLLFIVHKVNGDLDEKEDLEFNFYNISFPDSLKRIKPKLKSTPIESKMLQFLNDSFFVFTKYFEENNCENQLDKIFNTYSLFIFYKRYSNQFPVRNSILERFIVMANKLSSILVSKHFSQIVYGLYWCTKNDAKKSSQICDFFFLINIFSVYITNFRSSKTESNYVLFIFEKLLLVPRHKKHFSNDQNKIKILNFIEVGNFPNDKKIRIRKQYEDIVK